MNYWSFEYLIEFSDGGTELVASEKGISNMDIWIEADKRGQQRPACVSGDLPVPLSIQKRVLVTVDVPRPPKPVEKPWSGPIGDQLLSAAEHFVFGGKHNKPNTGDSNEQD